MKNWSNASSEPVMHRISASASDGRRSGSVIRRKRLRAARAVDRRGLVHLLRDGLQPDEQDQHVEAGVLPDDEEDRRQQRVEGRLEELDGVVDQPEALERRADRADGGRVEAPEQQRGGRQSDRPRQQEARPQEPVPAAALLHQQREPEAQPDQQDRDEDRVFDRERDGGPEQRVLRQRREVVGEVDPLVAGEQRPVAQGHPRHEQERDDEEDQDEDGRRQGVEDAEADVAVRRQPAVRGVAAELVDASVTATIPPGIERSG